MVGFVQSWFAPAANPIGIDFGSEGLRMAQVEALANPAAAKGSARDFKLIAAARADVPPHVRNDPAARFEFFARTVRELWPQGNFRGRRVVLSLPASMMTMCHLRLPRMEDDAIKKALPWEARGKLPYDPSRALLRHLVAGDVYQDGEQRSEIILMAAVRDSVNQFLDAATKAKLDVVGMNVEPKALVDCFANVYRRKSDAETTCCFVDIGCCATRAVIARGGQILFGRIVPVGGDHFNRAVAKALEVSVEDARAARIRQCEVETALPGPVLTPAPDELERGSTPEAARIEQACREPLAKLVEELALCRHYHDATFPNLPVGRLIFVGGESRHRGLCQQIARRLDLAAQVGDPLARMGRMSDIGIECGIDRRLPQPDWAVAIGLSTGPAPAGTTFSPEPTTAAPADAAREAGKSI
jgi:type IV pilus assembly protein PilM